MCVCRGHLAEGGHQGQHACFYQVVNSGKEASQKGRKMINLIRGQLNFGCCGPCSWKLEMSRRLEGRQRTLGLE